MGGIYLESLELRIFREVAYEKSISKAATKLGYVQSNVTAHIQNLEQELGTSLFIRHNKGATLTDDGKKLLSYADQIIHLLDNAKNQFINTSLKLNIGATQTIAARKLPIWLSIFKQKYPEVTISLTTNQQSNLIDAVANQDLDCAFINTEYNNSKLKTAHLFSEKLAIITGYDSIEEISNHPIIVTNIPGRPYHSLLENWILKRAHKHPEIIEFDTLESIIKAVSLKMGSSLLPDSVLTMEHKLNVFYDDEIGSSHIKLIIPNENDNPILQQFIDIVQENTQVS